MPAKRRIAKRNRLDNVLAVSGISQAKLAKVSGVSISTIRRTVNKQVDPTTKTKTKIANAVNSILKKDNKHISYKVAEIFSIKNGDDDDDYPGERRTSKRGLR